MKTRWKTIVRNPEVKETLKHLLWPKNNILIYKDYYAKQNCPKKNLRREEKRTTKML
jgi:hypothetical protein